MDYCRIIFEKEYTAHKDYIDDAGVWVNECLDDIRYGKVLTFAELRAIARLKDNGWKIKKGQRYHRSFNEFEGDVYTFRCLPEIQAICVRLDLYDV